MRTVKTILVQRDEKFRMQTDALREMLRIEFNRLDTLSEDQISILMSLMPLMTPRNISVGSHCVD